MARIPRAKRKSAVTRIADVARLAGVSPATVSRALAQPDIVTAETRKRVLDAVRRTGYTPNIAGRNLRAGRSMLALVVVPDIANPFFSEVFRGIDQTLAATGYGMIIASLDNSTERMAQAARIVFAGQVDGVILLNGNIPKAQGRAITDAAVPIVAACEIIPGATFPQVEIDNRAATRRVVARLAELGHRRIAWLSGPADNILEKARRAGFEEGAAAAGIAREEQTILGGDFTFRAGARAAERILALKARPTAVFAANDEMAIGFLKTIQAGGLSVPHDLSIVGFDGIDYADFCEPTLTTVRQPRHALGMTAAKLLAALMANRNAKLPRLTRLDVEHLWRASTAAAPAVREA
jgi:LacI family repressor for deo operon, udp, cdd, tsx, nupC, and nupG